MGELVAVVATVVASTGAEAASTGADAAQIAIPATGSVVGVAVLPGLMISTNRAIKARPPL